MHAQESVCQYAAVEERPQLPFHKTRNRAFTGGLDGKIRFKVIGNNPIQRIVFRIAGTVFGGCFANTKMIGLYP